MRGGGVSWLYALRHAPLTLSFGELLCQSHCRRCSLTSVSSARHTSRGIQRSRPIGRLRVFLTRCVPYRGVKMRRRSFTPRFASKTIRSLAHFHAAEDEGKALVCNWLFRARGPRRKYFRWGKSHPNESVSVIWSKHRGNVMLKGENRVSVSQGMLLPLLPSGYSSPTRNRGQSS